MEDIEVSISLTVINMNHSTERSDRSVSLTKALAIMKRKAIKESVRLGLTASDRSESAASKPEYYPLFPLDHSFPSLNVSV